MRSRFMLRFLFKGVAVTMIEPGTTDTPLVDQIRQSLSTLLQSNSVYRPPTRLSINEWLANPKFQFSDDFVELFNSNSAPVALGGLFFSEQPLGNPRQHAIAPLSFIPAGGFAVFRADGNLQAGADHLNFKLASEQGAIGLPTACPSGSRREPRRRW